MRMTTQNSVACLLSFVLVLFVPKKLNAVGPCIYDLSPKGIIDLTSVGRTDGTPMWKNIPPEKYDAHVYSYNPCSSFTQDSCINVAACQAYGADVKLTYTLGTQNSLQWKIIPGQDLPTLLYSTSERTLYVYLNCLSSGEPNKLDVHGYDNITRLYSLTLSSKCACWDGCKDGPGPGPGPGPKPPGGITFGTIFIIIIAVCLIIYLVVFMTFNKYKRQATGIDILPHRTFWTSLPGYSLGGVIFIFRKLTGKGTAYSSVS